MTEHVVPLLPGRAASSWNRDFALGTAVSAVVALVSLAVNAVRVDDAAQRTTLTVFVVAVASGIAAVFPYRKAQARAAQEARAGYTTIGDPNWPLVDPASGEVRRPAGLPPGTKPVPPRPWVSHPGGAIGPARPGAPEAPPNGFGTRAALVAFLVFCVICVLLACLGSAYAWYLTAHRDEPFVWKGVATQEVVPWTMCALMWVGSPLLLLAVAVLVHELVTTRSLLRAARTQHPGSVVFVSRADGIVTSALLRLKVLDQQDANRIPRRAVLMATALTERGIVVVDREGRGVSEVPWDWVVDVRLGDLDKFSWPIVVAQRPGGEAAVLAWHAPRIAVALPGRFPVGAWVARRLQEGGHTPA